MYTAENESHILNAIYLKSHNESESYAIRHKIILLYKRDFVIL